MTKHLPTVQSGNWRPRTYLVGGLTGILVGVLAAYFYARAAEEAGAEGPGRIKSMDALALAVALLSLLRQITDLGGKDK